MYVLILSIKILIIFQWVYILICIDINSIEDINLIVNQTAATENVRS